jgi:Xaa-Pro aminopeptidase
VTNPVSVTAAPALRFSRTEFELRVGSLRQRLADQAIDIYVGTIPEHIIYFSGFEMTGVYFESALFVTPQLTQPILLTHKAEVGLARATSWLDDIRVWRHGENAVATTLGILREVGIRPGMRVGIEMDGWFLKPSTYQRLLRDLPNVELVDVTRIGTEMRIRKSPAEIEYMRKAAKYADIGMAAAIDAIKPGVSEFEVSSRIHAAMYGAGSESPAFPFIVGSGPRSGLFHAMPSERIIEEGDPVMIELTGVSARYNSNQVRTFVAGEASPMLRKLHAIVLEAFETDLAAVRPGVALAEVDRISKRILKGYEDYIPTRTGFGVGLAYPPIFISPPDILETDDHVFEPGMVLSLEPSIAGYQGITMIFGYNFLVTENGAETLNTTPASIFELKA